MVFNCAPPQNIHPFQNTRQDGELDQVTSEYCLSFCALRRSCTAFLSVDGWIVIRILGEHPGHPSHLIQLFPTCQQRPWFASHGNRSLCPVLSEGSDGTCLPAMCETQSVHWSDTAKTQVVDFFLREREREPVQQIYKVNTQKTPHFALRHCEMWKRTLMNPQQKDISLSLQRWMPSMAT